MTDKIYHFDKDINNPFKSKNSTRLHCIIAINYQLNIIFSFGHYSIHFQLLLLLFTYVSLTFMDNNIADFTFLGSFFLLSTFLINNRKNEINIIKILIGKNRMAVRCKRNVLPHSLYCPNLRLSLILIINH